MKNCHYFTTSVIFENKSAMFVNKLSLSKVSSVKKRKAYLYKHTLARMNKIRSCYFRTEFNIRLQGLAALVPPFPGFQGAS